MQRVVCLRVDGSELSACAAEDRPLVQHLQRGHIGLHDAPRAIHQHQRRCDAVEDVGQCGRFHLVLLDHFSDEHGAADMRNNEAHVAAGRLVRSAIALVAKHAAFRIGRRRFFERSGNEIDPALRLRPLFIELRRPKFIVRHNVFRADDLLDRKEKPSCREWIQRDVFFKIRLHELRLDAVHIKDIADLANGILRIQRRRRAADELADTLQSARP